jgi:hypothetical protein
VLSIPSCNPSGASDENVATNTIPVNDNTNGISTGNDDIPVIVSAPVIRPTARKTNAVEHGSLLSMEATVNRPASDAVAGSLRRLHQRIRKPDRQMSQGTRCSKTAETGESVSLGRSKKREDRTVNGALHLINNPGRNGPGSQAI